MVWAIPRWHRPCQHAVTAVMIRFHGTGGLAYLLGGGVNGGQVVANPWPGLAPTDLYNDEDLQITTDLRSVLSEMLTKRLGANASDLGSIFPGFSGPNTANVFLP